MNKELYYLDNIKPSLNICKKADSPLGIKRSMGFSLNLSKAKRGKKYSKLYMKTNIIPKISSVETRLKISERARGVQVKVFDKNNNLIYQFLTMASAAKHLGVDSSTISKIFRTGISYDNYIYKFEVKDIRVWVYDTNNKLIKIMENFVKTFIFYKIPSTTLHRYIKSGKLYKNKYYFRIKCN